MKIVSNVPVDIFEGDLVLDTADVALRRKMIRELNDKNSGKSMSALINENLISKGGEK